MRKRAVLISLFTALFAALALVGGCSAGAGASASAGSAGVAGPSSAASEAFGEGALADAAASASASGQVESGSASAASQGDPELAAQLKAAMKDVADDAGMDVGVCVIDLETGTRAGVAAEKRFASASMIKLIVAETFLSKAEAGDFDLDDEYTLKSEDIVGGTGSIGGRGTGAQVTYRDLVQKMISISDNTATNALIGEVGMKAVNAEAKRLGLKATKLERLMMDEQAIAQGKENYTCAGDLALLLQMVHDGTFVSPKASKLALEALEAQEVEEGIADGLPEDVKFAHKTGSLGSVQHDGGIVEGERPYVLVVLCGGDGFNLDGALETMADAGRATWKILGD